jgi:hypothetical protein
LRFRPGKPWFWTIFARGVPSVPDRAYAAMVSKGGFQGAVVHAELNVIARSGPVNSEHNQLTKADSVIGMIQRIILTDRGPIDGTIGAVMRKTQIIPQPKMIIRPWCESCDAQMWLVSIEPDKPDYDRRTFECPRCQHEMVEIVKYK